MSVHICHREDEVLDALARDYIGPELAAHLEECASCGELRLVAGALLDERADAILEATLPSAGTMWWRMQVRHRQEIQAVARRSLMVGQAVTLAIALFLVAALLGGDLVVGVLDTVAAIRLSTPLLLTLGTWLLLAPIAGYVAIRQK